VFALMNVTIPDNRFMSLRLSRPHRAHPRWALLAAAITALALASPAGAQYSLPPDNSGADQYVPPVPDPGGNRPANPGHSKPGSLSPSVRRSLPSGSEGLLLARLATDPGSGAPSSASGQGSSRGGGGTGDGKSSGDESGGGAGGRTKEADATATSAITSAISDNPSVGLLAGAILVLTVAAAAVGLGSRRRRRF
jgi:hypothetical protein